MLHSKGRKKPQRSGRGGGRAQRAHRRGGGQRPPPPALVLRALRARKTPPPRRAPLRYPAPPWPAGIRRPYGGCSWEAGRPGRPRGGAAAFGGRGAAPGPPPGLPNKKRGPEAKPPARAFQDASRPAAAPPLGFPLTPKRQRKSQAFRPTRPRPVHRPEKGGSDREPLRGRLQPSRRAERGFFRRGAATE